MAFTGPKMNKGKLLAATVFALGLLTSSAYAYTPELQQMCSGMRCGFAASISPMSTASRLA